MASYTDNLNLFKPGSDDNIGIETSLEENFSKVDTKLGDMLKDLDGKVWDSAGARVNEFQKSMKTYQGDMDKLKKKNPNERLDHHFFRSIAHRGASGTAPENTMIAFSYAIEMGFWGIETDIHLTSDKKWVCIHDETVDRTSSGTGTVKSKTLTQLKALDFGSWYDPIFINQRIPTIEEFLEICKLGNVVPYIELKTGYTDVEIEGLVKIIRDFDMEDSSVIISFTLTNLQKVRYYSDYLALGYVTSTFNQKAVDDTVELGNAFLNVAKAQVTAANMQLAKAKKVQVEAWTVDTNRETRALSKLGVRAITTNEIPYVRGY